MIVHTHYISLLTNDTNVEYDENGFPKENYEEWSELIKVQFNETNLNQIARSGDVEYTFRGGVVLVDFRPVRATKLKLFDKELNELGEFPIKATRYYKSVRQTHIAI